MHRGTAVARVSTVAVDLMPIARRQQVADDIAAGRGMASLSHLNFTSFGPSVCRMKAARNVQLIGFNFVLSTDSNDKRW
jgi:hypothetical protein